MPALIFKSLADFILLRYGLKCRNSGLSSYTRLRWHLAHSEITILSTQVLKMMFVFHIPHAM